MAAPFHRNASFSVNLRIYFYCFGVRKYGRSSTRMELEGLRSRVCRVVARRRGAAAELVTTAFRTKRKSRGSRLTRGRSNSGRQWARNARRGGARVLGCAPRRGDRPRLRLGYAPHIGRRSGTTSRARAALGHTSARLVLKTEQAATTTASRRLIFPVTTAGGRRFGARAMRPAPSQVPDSPETPPTPGATPLV